MQLAAMKSLNEGISKVSAFKTAILSSVSISPLSLARSLSPETQFNPFRSHHTGTLVVAVGVRFVACSELGALIGK